METAIVELRGIVVSIAVSLRIIRSKPDVYIFVLGCRRGRCRDNGSDIGTLDLERLEVTKSVKLQKRVTMQEAELARTLEELISDGIVAGS